MIDKYNDKLVSIIHNHLPGCKIYLFGIRYKGEKGEENEIEIAIDAGKISDVGIIGNIYADIKEELYNLDVDIVDFNTASEQMKENILKKGVLLYKKA
ncbi:hypothetical protein KAT08_00420 [Candidatus Babeliales bacterium]|nr:hypothetical protein [Candidatus Babeliales bacterium]